MISTGYKMPDTIDHRNKTNVPSFEQLYRPIRRAMIGMPPLVAQGHRPLKMTFDDQLKALIFFYLEEHVSGQHLLQVLEEDDFARDYIAPEEGIKKSSFAEAINSGDLNSSSTYTRTCKRMLSLFYQKNIPTLGISLVSMVP
jgi:hypothetical protein